MTARILVVDDEPGVLALCQRFLTRSGFGVATAASADEALTALSGARIDLLLVDVRMPGMDGFELMARARLLQPELAVVVMTGFGTLETAVRALEEGATGLVLKPFDSNQAVVRQVERALETTRAQHEAARSRALRPLMDLAEALFSETDEDPLARRVADAVRAHVGSELAGMFLVPDSGTGLRRLSWSGESEGSLEAAVVRGLEDWASEGQPSLRWSEGDEADAHGHGAWMRSAGLGAAMVLANRRGQGTYLVFTARGQGRPPFSESELELLDLLARQASLAVENARLYGALRAYVNEVERSHQRLLQSEKLAAIGRLTASIAHEVNNPLQSLRNCLDLAGRPEMEASRRQEYLHLAQKEVEDLSGIVRQMLEFYRPEAATRTPVDVNRILEDVGRLTAAECEQKGIRVAIALGSGIPSVWGVAFQIQQVVMNLVLNAIQAMPAGGLLAMESRARGQAVEVAIRDSGEGIRREEIPHIFEPFYTSKQTGTGLGLAISYGIVSAHGGTLRVESDVGVGSTFVIRLPAGDLP